MIINKQGEKCLCSNGVEYIIGEEVIGTENGDYEGLIGRIYEIRIGEADKETDNDTSDFYCTFEPPILEPDIRKLEERFSQIYGSPKSLNDICLDSVILAPDMVKPVSSIEDEAKECNVYVLEEDWAANDDYGHDVDIFTDLNSAKISMLKQLKKEVKDGCIPDWKDDDDYIEETDENSFECYIDGYYSERHYSISIVEKPMKMSERFMAEISESMISQDMLSQFRTQVLKLKETELLSDAEYEQLLKDNSVAEVIKDKISGDDDFWDAYDSIISEVAREEVVKYTEKE